MKALTKTMAIGLLALAGMLWLDTQTANAAEQGVVNINTATAKQLELLQGIGPKKAQAIVEFRAKQPFRSVDELERVQGIGKKLVDALRPYLAVQGETTLKTPIKRTREKTAKRD